MMNQLWSADLKNGTFQNPLLYTDYSDPDVIRVGADYYMIASSFTYVPGVPVLHSKDLVNWELINYVVREIPFSRYNQPAHGAGTWAPSLRYHNGTFYAFIPMPDEGIFVSETKDPYGDWSPLRCLKQAKGWIDPCPLWDSDGKAYMVFAYARSRCGIKNRLSVVEMNADATELLSEPKLIYDGIQANPTIEGPKFYKKDGWYYIFAPAGGVATGWQTVLRAKHVYGPYEYKIVMHQGNTAINGPHQGGYVETPEGDSYFIHFQDVGPYGRICHLQPMCWNGGWPFIGQERNGDGIGEPVEVWDKPVAVDWTPKPIPSSDDFHEKTLGLQWQWQANPDHTFYSLEREPDNLVLFCRQNERREDNLLWYAPNACNQMLQAPAFLVETCITLKDEEEGDLAGIGIIGHQYSYVAVERRNNEIVLNVRTGVVKDPEGAGLAEESIQASVTTGGKKNVYFRLYLTNGGKYHYEYSFDKEHYYSIGMTYQAVKASWTGAKFTLFACNSFNHKSNGYGCYEYVTFTTDMNQDGDSCGGKC